VLAGKLAVHFTHVTGIDADEGMAAVASGRLGDQFVSGVIRAPLWRWPMVSA
jgi:hypothetical protein